MLVAEGRMQRTTLSICGIMFESSSGLQMRTCLPSRQKCLPRSFRVETLQTLNLGLRISEAFSTGLANGHFNWAGGGS